MKEKKESLPLCDDKKKCVSDTETHFLYLKTNIPPKIPPRISVRILNMAKSVVKYKTPRIVRAKRGWFIALYYERPDEPGTYKRFEISGGVNYIKDLREREKAIEFLRQKLIMILKDGFDPFYTKKEEILIEAIETKEESLKEKHWTLQDGFDIYMKECEERQLSQKSISKYRSNVNVVLEWVSQKGYEKKRIIEYTETDIQEFLNTTYELKKWSARSYNNYIDFLSYTFSTIEKLEKRVNGKRLQYNVDFDLVKKKTDRPQKNQAFIGKIRERVKEKLKAVPELNDYIQWLYLSCMRPSEIRDLTIKQIDIEGRQIYIEASSGKTGARIVPISDELYQLILKLKIPDYPHTYYVFGKGTKGPGAIQVSKRYFSDLFRKHVREPLWLSPRYTAYGWKHTRVIDLLNAGFSDYEVMSLTGHKGFESFEKYKRDLVIDNKKMKGKTIGFEE